MNHYFFMIGIMILAGLLSSMSIWAYRWIDVRISVNDFYMIGLMTAWMVFFMSLYDQFWIALGLSSIWIVAFYYFIRRQSFISTRQYYRGMIPHHSMAILASKRLLESQPTLAKEDWEFIENIIRTQEEEIQWMKDRINNLV